ncbi:hypothetical protein [Chitinophaga vietnamensis]|uniref:hypothetical protein n=1 Tax=Chitinophaga vietnamensis TaxID=2593957 RepID=UPI00117754B3|nr:hypothetical protein [Chitinophaga vietnamensis]
MFDPLFCSYGLLWGIIHLCRQLQCPVPLLNDHLTDFIAVPAMAHGMLTFTRSYIVQDPAYRYPLSWLLLIAAYTSFVFEWLMPHYSTRYTADIWDVAAYFAGSLFYYYIHQRTHLSFHHFSGHVGKQPQHQA